MKRGNTGVKKHWKRKHTQGCLKFIINPLADAFDESSFNADLSAPWDSIECVIIPEAVNQNRGSCSICLGNVRIPRMTRCHHVYCYTCVLRYMACSNDMHQKCPLCSEHFMKSDLKPVRFCSFIPPVDPTDGQPQPVITTMSQYRRSNKFKKHKQSDKTTYTFTLLYLEKGSICPMQPTALRLSATGSVGSGSGSGSVGNRVGLSGQPQHPLPVEGSPEAMFSRLSVLTAEGDRFVLTFSFVVTYLLPLITYTLITHLPIGSSLSHTHLRSFSHMLAHSVVHSSGFLELLAEERSELHRFRNECLSAVHTYHTATTMTSGSSASGGLIGSSSSSSSSGVDDSGSGAANSHPWGAFRKKLATAPAGTGSGSSTNTSPSASQPVIHWPQLTTSTSSSSPTVTGTEIGSTSRTTANHGEAVVGSVDEGDDVAGETGTVMMIPS